MTQLPCNHSLTIICPVSQLAMAQIIGRTVDPDVGGALSFGLRATDGANKYAVMHMPCDELFAQAAPWLGAAEILWQTVCHDIELRWPDAHAPTLTEVEAFLATATITVDTPLDEALVSRGLTLEVPDVLAD